jgi:basic membrane protein A and related proteins
MGKFLKAIFIIALLGVFCTGVFAKQLKIGIVLGLGGLGDKSFNDSAFHGLQEAQKKLGIKFKYVEPTSNAENEQYLRMFAQGGYDLTIATGFLMQNACAKVAKEFPNSKFAVIDCVVNEPNVASLVFNEEQSSFLAVKEFESGLKYRI